MSGSGGGGGGGVVGGVEGRSAGAAERAALPGGREGSFLLWRRFLSFLCLLRSFSPAFFPLSTPKTKKKQCDLNSYVRIPSAVLDMPRELFRPPRAWVAAGSNLKHFTRAGSGGHFAALERPAVFVRDVRDFFSNWGR